MKLRNSDVSLICISDPNLAHDIMNDFKSDSFLSSEKGK